MTPLAAALPFASKCCSVGAELLAVYAGNTGFITSSSNGSDYAMQATAQSQQLAQLRQVSTTHYTYSQPVVDNGM
jgi:putative NADH-flavin reductase